MCCCSHGHDPARPESSYWFTIGGAVESGESLTAAAVRELWEETGIEITEQRLGPPSTGAPTPSRMTASTLSPMKASSRRDSTTSRLPSTESKATRSSTTPAGGNPDDLERAPLSVPDLPDLMRRAVATAILDNSDLVGAGYAVNSD